MANEFGGRSDIADALISQIVSAQEIRPFNRPSIFIPRYSASLKRISFPVRAENFGKGEAAQIDDGLGFPTFAELLICERLRRAGWEAVWASGFGSLRFINSWPWNLEKAIERDSLPSRIMGLLKNIAVIRSQRVTTKNLFGGISDVVAWRNTELILIESKRAKKDRLGVRQYEWIYSAYDAGLPIENLGIFEWSIENELD